MAQQSPFIQSVLLNNGHQSYTAVRRCVSSTPLFIFFFLLLFAAIIFIQPPSKITSLSFLRTVTNFRSRQKPQHFTLDCINGSSTTCPANHPRMSYKVNKSSTEACPEYFRWIHEDLKPWKDTGITRDIVETARNISDFRLVILKGKVYVEKRRSAFQTRDVFTIWGILQFLRFYPGEVPDLELFFQCGDRTVVDKTRFQGSPAPPPVFHYSGRESAFDIVFPDWSFWGWAEIHINPWEAILHAIQKKDRETKWKDRVPYALWKGNTRVFSLRKKLCKCNVSDEHDWNARIYDVNWKKESKKRFHNTKLEDQCTHRYKIYVEGVTWSVSEKYILACDSMTLFVRPRYYDFFSRSLVPLQHYWPISTKNICQDIKFAVDWGNTHIDKAQEIGREGSDYIIQKLKMKFIYDYMFHLLQEYARLMRFDPAIPAGAVEVCSETMACSKKGVLRKFMVDSMVTMPSSKPPCTLPPPYKPEELQDFLQRKETSIKQVEIMKNGTEYHNSLSNAKQ